MGRLKFLLFTLAAAAVVVSCGCKGCGPEPPSVCNLGAPRAETMTPAVVKYCAAPVQTTRLRTQFLVDDSGSMAGFRSSLPQLYQFVSQAASHMSSGAGSDPERRGCYFSKQRGLRCAAGMLNPASFTASGNTILHTAIEASSASDVSVILTDGVAATGSGTGNCAGGVDAACVASALASALRPLPGEPQSIRSGVWLLPLAASFDGPLYTEQLIRAADFDTRPALQSVIAETGTNASISAPANDNDGGLHFRYLGPRYLFLLVIARQADLGRSMVSALASVADSAGILPVASMRTFQSGVAMLPPIEIFPGYIPPLEWASADIEASGTRQLMCGQLDTNLEGSTLRTSCSPDKNAAIVRLEPKPDTRASNCFTLHVLPRISVDAREPQDSPRVIEDWRLEEAASGGTPSMRVKLACDNAWGLPCGAGEYKMTWFGRPDYPASADCLANQGCDSPGAAALRSISTTRTASSPHRIQGLRETVEKFYQNIAGKAEDIPFAGLGVCKSATPGANKGE